MITSVSELTILERTIGETVSPLELSPPALNDDVPRGDHVITPTPISLGEQPIGSNGDPPSTSTTVTLFSGSCMPPALHALLTAPKPSAKADDNLEYFKDEECTIDIEVGMYYRY